MTSKSATWPGVSGAEGLCRFPHFLFPVPRGRRLTYVWTTEARYRGASSHVPDTQLEVTVLDGDTLVTKMRHVGGLCAQQRANATCLHREFFSTPTPPVYIASSSQHQRHLSTSLVPLNINATCLHREFFSTPTLPVYIASSSLHQRHLSTSRVPLSKTVSGTYRWR